MTVSQCFICSFLLSEVAEGGGDAHNALTAFRSRPFYAHGPITALQSQSNRHKSRLPRRHQVKQMLERSNALAESCDKLIHESCLCTYLSVRRRAGRHRRPLDLALCDQVREKVSGSERVCDEFGRQGGVLSGDRRDGGGGSRRGPRGEGSHLHGQVLCAGQAEAEEVLVRFSVHHQQPRAVGDLPDPLHHLHKVEMVENNSVLYTERPESEHEDKVKKQQHYIQYIT